jgi:hypothetical protein
MSEVLERGKFYPLGDSLTLDERRRFDIPLTQVYNLNVMGTWTGEKRQVKPGEWFLSGASIAAYRSTNGTLGEYHIARLAKVRKETRIIEEGTS